MSSAARIRVVMWPLGTLETDPTAIMQTRADEHVIRRFLAELPFEILAGPGQELARRKRPWFTEVDQWVSIGNGSVSRASRGWLYAQLLRLLL